MKLLRIFRVLSGGVLVAMQFIEVLLAQSITTDGALLSTQINGLETIENTQVKIGVDSRFGGAITFLNHKTVNDFNMINNPDLGRSLQIGLYGGPVPYSENGKQPHPSWYNLGWNPIQAGDVYGNPSQVIAFEKRENLLYVKTIPKHFPLNNVPGECYIEQWIRLDGNVVKVHAKITMFRSDHTQYQARDQELPCIYPNSKWHKLWGYTGNKTYDSNESLSSWDAPNFETVQVNEPWMAATDVDGWGVGLFAPDCYQWRMGFFGQDKNSTVETYTDASYIAANNFVLLDHNMQYEWDYQLILGHINDIRSYVYQQPRSASGPNYRFTTNRKGWYYFNAQDAGWPIQTQLHVYLTNKERDQIKSPAVFWHGKDSKKIYIRAAFQTQHDKFRMHWRHKEDYDFLGLGDRYKDFTIVNDGEFRVYEIDLSNLSSWTDADIIQMQLRPPWDGPDVNGWVKIEWVSTSATGPKETVIDEPPVDPTKNNDIVNCDKPICLPVYIKRIK